MIIAQQLYEGVDIKGEGTIGIVSYIRTDSFRISDEAYEQAVQFIDETYGKEYVNPERAVYKSKRKKHKMLTKQYDQQSASRTPESIKDSLSKDQYKLYKLIWEKVYSESNEPCCI